MSTNCKRKSVRRGRPGAGQADRAQKHAVISFDEIREEKVSASLIFFSCGDAAANVALGFIDLKDLLDLKVKTVIDMRQSVLNILMYR